MAVGLRFGVGVRQFGRWGSMIETQTRLAEEAGFDSIWLGDHIISPQRVDSAYPYTESGQVPWEPEVEMYDAVVSASVAAAVTSQITIGFGTLVLALRQPIVLAKQLATLDRLSRGRVVLGAGVGWMREEFAALGVDFEHRIGITAEWIELLRACWTGDPGIIQGRHYELRVPTVFRPIPAGRLPILVGGVSAAARQLAACHGQGWYPLLSAEQLDRGWLEPRWRDILRKATEAGRDPSELVLTIYAAADLDIVCARLDALADVGVSEVVVGIDWDEPGSAQSALQQLQEASGTSSRSIRP